MPSGLYLCIFAVACGCLTLLGIGRSRSLRRSLPPASSHRCRARPLFSHLGRSSFRLDALVEACDDPGVPPGWAVSLPPIPPAPRGGYLFSRGRGLVGRGPTRLVPGGGSTSAPTCPCC